MKIYNTMSGQTEDFKEIKKGQVRMYVCGPTVYNYFHIGNARPFIVFDTFRNFLKYKGYNVVFVQNVTDIDDKIINKANEEKTTWDKIAAKYTAAYLEDIEKLKIERPDISPKATEEIEKMIELINKLIDNGYAYVAENGVYFSVEKFNDYGRLSHKNIDQLQEGARVEVDEKKEKPLDFALWKFSKPGEPSWKSPWGDGRPGWHIECSSMSSKYLGDTFDIHGGGIDLVFPHHENELAQSEAASGKPFVNYWMHNGYMNIKGEKMSKSVGNIVLAREVLEKYPAEVIRMFILSAHYRSPLDFTYENVDTIKSGYREIYYTLQRLAQVEKAEGAKTEGSSYVKSFNEALDDDFNTPKAIAVIYDLLNVAKNTMNRPADEESKITFALLEKNLQEMCGVLKIMPGIEEVNAEIKGLVKKREELRKNKNYKEADDVKKEIGDKGYVLEDTRSGTFVIKELK